MENVTSTSPPPVVVTMIGHGTGDGGAPIPDGITLKTPDHQPDVTVNVVRPIVAIGVRFVNLFLTTFIGLLTAAGIGVEAHAVSATFQVVFQTSLMSAAIVAGMGSLKDAATIFSGLEKRFPLGTGSI